MKRFILAAAAVTVLVSACASDGAPSEPAQTAASADYDDPPVGTLIKRKRSAAAGTEVGKIDPKALENLRNLDNGRMGGQ